MLRSQCKMALLPILELIGGVGDGNALFANTCVSKNQLSCKNFGEQIISIPLMPSKSFKTK